MMPCMTLPPRREQRECRHRPSFREGPDRVFTLQTKLIRSHHNNASSEEGYVENIVVVSTDGGRARLSLGSKSNSTQQTKRLGR
jgi:hypothetical protein